MSAASIRKLIPSEEELRRIRKRTRDRNYRFSKLSPVRKRKAIARDVIKSLKAKRFFAAQMGYFTGGTPTGVPKEAAKTARRFRDLMAEARNDHVGMADQVGSIPLNAILEDLPCTVCGIGACFVAAVDKVDGLTLADVDGRMKSDSMREFLKQWFSIEQIRMIEAAFERSSHFAGDYGVHSQFARAAANFGARYDDPTDRLMAIMRSIIDDHSGEFNP